MSPYVCPKNIMDQIVDVHEERIAVFLAGSSIVHEQECVANYIRAICNGKLPEEFQFTVIFYETSISSHERRGFLEQLSSLETRFNTQQRLEDLREFVRRLPLGAMADRELALEVASTHAEAIQFVHPTLLEDVSFVAKLLQSNHVHGGALLHAHPSLHSDRYLAKIALRAGLRFSELHESLLGDKELTLDAIWRDGSTLACVDTHLKADKEFVMKAVDCNWHALSSAAECWRADRDVVLTALHRDGRALQFASEELKAERAVVVSAVNKTGCALQFAHVSLREDRDIVLQAVSNDSRALQFASETRRQDEELRRLTRGV